MNNSTIKISKETKEDLDKRKLCKRESYDDVLKRLIEDYTNVEIGIPISTTK